MSAVSARLRLRRGRVARAGDALHLGSLDARHSGHGAPERLLGWGEESPAAPNVRASAHRKTSPPTSSISPKTCKPASATSAGGPDAGPGARRSRHARGGDLIVQARTGSGKTGAFGIPIVAVIDRRCAAPQAIVLAPTRELANQVATELDRRSASTRACARSPIYGGVGYGPQNEGLARARTSSSARRAASSITSAPAACARHDQVLRARRGRRAALARLLARHARDPELPAATSRQTCLFSATMPEKVRALSRIFQSEPEFVTLSRARSRRPRSSTTTT